MALVLSADSRGEDSPRREFRAAWVATVANIDWPSRPGLTTAEQRRELTELLDVAERLNLNALIFQVRPACDALYASELEPWSEFLTGEMGRPPEPFYDPLELIVRQAHERGIELHAWFNPYRALHSSSRGPVSAGHVSRTQPQIVREYGDYLWLDPGEQAARDHTMAVIMDVVRRYDIDGVHFDDYFYPYPVEEEIEPAAEPAADGSQASSSEEGDRQAKPPRKRKVPFPDDASWERAIAGMDPSQRENRDHWRRQNVDRLIERLYHEVKAEKPWVKVGISPFGIWRPGNPAQIKGFDQYAEIYADARKWLQEGWVDYFTPQLYWEIGPPAQSYSALLAWWHSQNKHDRHLWPGNFTSRLLGGENRAWESDEVLAQIWVTRAQAGATGNVHFSMKALARNADGIADKLRAGPYRHPALVPESPWLEPRPSPEKTADE